MLSVCEGIPRLQKVLRVLLDSGRDLTKFVRLEAPGSRKPDGIKPDFSDAVLPLYMNVSRLVQTVLGIKE